MRHHEHFTSDSVKVIFSNIIEIHQARRDVHTDDLGFVTVYLCCVPMLYICAVCPVHMPGDLQT